MCISFPKAFILLWVSGLHVAWGIHQALFYDPYNIFGKRIECGKFDRVYEEFGVLFSIVSWYAGVMLGSAGVGYYLAPNVSKKMIYVSVTAHPHHFYYSIHATFQ